MNRTGPKGNRHRLERHARRILRDLRSGALTLGGLMDTYRVAFPTAKTFIAEHIGPEEWAEIVARNLRRCGRRGRFKKGHRPWSAGRKGIHLSPETEFKKGCLRGQAARNWRPLGTITVRRDHLPRHLRNRKRKGGRPWPRRTRRFIKVCDFGPTQNHWIPVARWYWQLAYGPIPPGLCVVYADGDSMNDSLANYRLVDHADHLAIQEMNDPKMRERQRKALSRATTARHAAARAVREAARKRPPPIVHWHCRACGATYADAPDRCPHCGGGAFERTEISRVA